jgi:hypothetical protein
MEDYSEIRKLIRESIQEEFESSKETRYSVTMDFYVWANDDEDAVNKAKALAKEMDSKYDNRALVQSIDKQPHGTMISIPVEFNKFG